MITTCTRRIQFCAGHRVLGHENKCGNLHGHNYVAHVTARLMDKGQANHTDGIGRVIDFSVLKTEIGGWIDAAWDHGFIIHEDDKGAAAALQLMSHHMEETEGRRPQKLYRMPYNPTAENMAKYLVTVIAPRALAGTGVIVTKCVIEETENCSAEYSIDSACC